MNLKEIGEETSYLLVGEPVNLMTVTKFTNRCMDVLANRYDTACIRKEIAINITDTNTDYDLPDDLIGIYKVIDVNNNKFKDFVVSDKAINISSKGNFTVKYYAIPVLTTREGYDFNIKTDIPPIDNVYHKCIPYYIAMELLKINDAKSPQISIYIQDFVQECKEADTRMKRLKRRNSRIKAPVWR